MFEDLSWQWEISGFWGRLLMLLIAFLIIFVVLAIPFSIWYDYNHPCVKYADTATYHAPVYIKSGSALIPVGGGTYKDCIERD